MYAEEKVSKEKPAFFDQIVTEPKYFVDYEAFKKEQPLMKKQSIIDDIEPLPVKKPITVEPKSTAIPTTNNRAVFDYKPVNTDIKPL